MATSLHTHVSVWTISSCLAEGNMVSRCPVRVLPLIASHVSFVCRGVGNKNLDCYRLEPYSYESRLSLGSNDGRVLVWSPLGCGATQGPTAGVIIWVTIAYNSWSPLVVIRGTLTVICAGHPLITCCLPWQGYRLAFSSRIKLANVFLACTAARLITNQALKGPEKMPAV